MIGSIRSLRKFVVLAVVALALGGCDGDAEEEASTGATTSEQTSERTTSTETATGEVDPETETLPDDGDGTGTGDESGQGGAGDEQPAETYALFTGEDGVITPLIVRVPAFISIRVELRSGDGEEYGLTFEGKTIKVPSGLSSVSTTLDGLRPGTKLVGTPIGATRKVRIEATAEPGP